MCKTAVVLDTNFIYAKSKQMNDLLQVLNEDYVVYISQISVDERKEQRCRDFEKAHKEVKKFYSEFAFAGVGSNSINADETLNKIRNGMQQKYELAFPEHIISNRCSC